MTDIRADAFSGINLLSSRRELEIPKNTSLRKAKNVTINPDGSLSIITGSLSRGSGTPWKYIWYANSIDRYFVFDPVNVKTEVLAASAVDGNFSVTATFTGGSHNLEDNDVILGTGPTMVDWNVSKVQYFSTGGLTAATKIRKFSSTGTAVGSFEPDSGVAVHMLCQHKNTLWFADRTTIYPSDSLLPETFDVTNGIKIVEGSAYITGMHSMGGILFVHEKNDITAVYRNAFTGSTADVRKVKLGTGSGMIRPSAHCVHDGICFYMGMNGFYMFDGESCKPIPQQLGLTLARNIV